MVTEHKNQLILDCVSCGFSPQETAAIFLKQAEVINACADALLEEHHTKTALISNLGNLPGYMLAGTLAVPPLLGFMGGHFMGNTAAEFLSPRNELPISLYQKIDEIKEMRQKTEDIKTRTEEAKKKNKNREKERSSRSLF